MPITIKSSRMQYRKSNGDYVGVDAVSERKTSEMIADIEEKGEETIDSIPFDYTTLSNDVRYLKSATGNKSSLNTDTKTDLVSAINEVNGHFLDGIDVAVENWLDEHPEATTTVQDNSLTFEKLVKGTLGFVTPEMYGAVGDGSTDDTVAFQQAVNSGKPILLKSDYVCGKISGENIYIFGAGHTIINKTNDVLFSASGDFIGENFTIANKEIYDYLTADDIYGSITAKNVYCKKITVVNVNSCAFYATGNIYIDGCKVDNSLFDVKTIYVGTDNHNFGLYAQQTENTHVISVKNTEFLYLIEGIYYGSYLDAEVSIEIDNNYFYYNADHCCYINSYENRARATISNNVCQKVCTAFVTVGNNHVIENNLVIDAYDGDRAGFGFSIRDGSNVLYKNNIFISGAYTSASGLAAGALITSLITADKRDGIVFDGNYFDINDATDTCPTWLRLGYGKSAPLGKVIFKNNYMSIKGYNYGITSNVDVEFILENNRIFFNQPFMNLMAGTAAVINNEIENTDNSSIFSILSKGIYKHNTFNTTGIPLRRATATMFEVEGNVNKYTGGGVYNLINADQTGLTHKCLIRGTFTATAEGNANVFGGADVAPAFKPKMFAFDDLGNELSFTVTQIRNGYIDISNITPGTHNFIIM